MNPSRWAETFTRGWARKDLIEMASKGSKNFSWSNSEIECFLFVCIEYLGIEKIGIHGQQFPAKDYIYEWGVNDIRWCADLHATLALLERLMFISLYCFKGRNLRRPMLNCRS